MRAELKESQKMDDYFACSVFILRFVSNKLFIKSIRLLLILVWDLLPVTEVLPFSVFDWIEISIYAYKYQLYT